MEKKNKKRGIGVRQKGVYEVIGGVVAALGGREQ